MAVVLFRSVVILQYSYAFVSFFIYRKGSKCRDSFYICAKRSKGEGGKKASHAFY